MKQQHFVNIWLSIVNKRHANTQTRTNQSTNQQINIRYQFHDDTETVRTDFHYFTAVWGIINEMCPSSWRSHFYEHNMWIWWAWTVHWNGLEKNSISTFFFTSEQTKNQNQNENELLMFRRFLARDCSSSSSFKFV